MVRSEELFGSGPDSDHSGAGGAAGQAGDEGAGALVGAAGQEYVTDVLTGIEPRTAIMNIQQRAGLPHGECSPLLGLLDQLGGRRADAYRSVYSGAKSLLLQRLPHLGPDRLLQLLDASFPYIGVRDLQDVPLKVLERLTPVPASYLKVLAGDMELFQQLPDSVQRQVWEMDRKLLQQHALPLVSAYAYEPATATATLDMHAFLPNGGYRAPRQGPPGAAPPPAALAPPRRTQREQSPVLQRLVAMVGRSRQVYKGVAALAVSRYGDGEGGGGGGAGALHSGVVREGGLCALRSQLLMALHDAPGGASELCSGDNVHKLAWTLDACLKDRKLNPNRLEELRAFFRPHDDLHAAAAASGRRAASRTSVGRRPNPGGDNNDAESAGMPGQQANEEPHRVLGDAAVVLRDPPVMYMLAHTIVRRLENNIERELLPSSDGEIAFLTRLLQMGIESRDMLRDRHFSMPSAPPRLLDTFYPLLAKHMVATRLRRVAAAAAQQQQQGGVGGGPGGQVEVELPDLPAWEPLLTDTLASEQAAQLVAQAYVLQRLVVGDVNSAMGLLSPLASALEGLAKHLVPFAPFAYSLGHRLVAMQAAGSLKVGSPLWQTAFDRVLLRCVDAEQQVHQVVLRLLLPAVGKMALEKLKGYIETALHNSRKSRRRMKKQAKKGGGAAGLLGDAGGHGGLGMEGVQSHVSLTSAAAAAAASDAEAEYLRRGHEAVRAMYARLAALSPELDDQNAGYLFAYLEGQ